MTKKCRREKKLHKLDFLVTRDLHSNLNGLQPLVLKAILNEHNNSLSCLFEEGDSKLDQEANDGDVNTDT